MGGAEGCVTVSHAGLLSSDPAGTCERIFRVSLHLHFLSALSLGLLKGSSGKCIPGCPCPAVSSVEFGM